MTLNYKTTPRTADKKIFLQPAHRFISENCFEEHPAGAASLVPAKRDCRAEGEENFAAGAKLFCF